MTIAEVSAVLSLWLWPVVVHLCFDVVIIKIQFTGFPSQYAISMQIMEKSSKSAPCPGGIPYTVYKKCPSVRKHLLHIFRKIWSGKEIVAAFGKAIVDKHRQLPETRDCCHTSSSLQWVDFTVHSFTVVLIFPCPLICFANTI